MNRVYAPLMWEAEETADAAVPESVVRKRRVFYIPGYDPFPPRRYRELYRREGRKQAEISGYEIAQKKAPEGDAWLVRCVTGGRLSSAKIEVLTWSDLVRASMDRGVLGSYAALLRTAWAYLPTGTFRRLMWLRKGPVLAGLYPVAMLLAQLALAVMIGWVLGGLVARFSAPWLGGGWLGWIVALPVIYGVLEGFRRVDRKLYAHYLMHDFAYSASHCGAYPEALEIRLAEFRARIGAALATDADEVLVVGHSSGAHLAVSVLADLLRQDGVSAGGPRLALLTLGQCIPMVSFLPEAHRLRRDLHDLSCSGALAWVDVSAPGDGCSFALCDPVAVSGVAAEGKRWPLVISAAFRNTLSEETWGKLRRRFFRLHFQYLCAFDRPGDYDYFQITAGPQTLADRFRGRKPSASRIDVAASRHTSMAA